MPETYPPAVTITGVNKRFGDYVAVDNLTLTIARGSCFGLLGPNGAGKTTTLRMLTTLLPADDGRIEIFGYDVAKHAMTVRRAIGYVPQQLSVEGALTAKENVDWFARLYDVPRKERKERVAQALDLVDLTDVKDRLASEFSGGMVRRLELAQALVNRPALLILDEPTVGLDPVARDSVWEQVVKMQAQYEMTVLLTTHYMEEADALCDQVALMHDGALATEGSPSELKSMLGKDATLEDVFRAHTGANLASENKSGKAGKGGLGSVASARRTARRLG